MRIRVGPPVRGANFYPRETSVRQLRWALERGHVSFLAPRRTGKTSILYHLEDAAPESIPHININLETCSTPKQWIEAMLTGLTADNASIKKGARAAWKGCIDQVKRIKGIKILGNGVELESDSGSEWEKSGGDILEYIDQGIAGHCVSTG